MWIKAVWPMDYCGKGRSSVFICGLREAADWLVVTVSHWTAGLWRSWGYTSRQVWAMYHILEMLHDGYACVSTTQTQHPCLATTSLFCFQVLTPECKSENMQYSFNNGDCYKAALQTYTFQI